MFSDCETVQDSFKIAIHLIKENPSQSEIIIRELLGWLNQR